jgi:hypothetical protein
MCGTCIDKGAGTSSQLVTASGNSMMNWEMVVAETKEHFALVLWSSGSVELLL